MRSIGAITVLAAAVCVQGLSQITRTGRYLYDDSGNRFSIKGIAYQEQGAVAASATNAFGEPSTFFDPLSDSNSCSRDIPFLQQLGVNTIRVYSVDSGLNHDACMSALSAAGIYTIIDLALPLNGSIDRINPVWATNVLDQYLATIDTFSKYDNILAYGVGNEVVVDGETYSSPFVKAAARDVKAYLKSKNLNTLVAYAAINGEAGWRDDLANFLSCDPSSGNSGSTAIDLYGLNDYSWCGDSTFEGAWKGTHDDFAKYNVAAYLSEFGCVVAGKTRSWQEAPVLFSSQMSDVWSGGLAFSYFEAASAAGSFGMVAVSSDGKTVTPNSDFDNLKTQYAAATLPTTPAKSAAGSETYPACPAESADFQASTTLPPTPNLAACTCLQSALSCHFAPTISNYSAVVGELIDVGCQLLGSKGDTTSCLAIGGNGTTGIYGTVSGCDPIIKASFVMSQYYEANNKDAQACSFAGNGTVNPSVTAAASAVVSSCVSNPSATFAPSAAPTTTAASGGSTSTVKSGNGNGNGAVFADANAMMGAGVALALTFFSAVLTLV